MRKFILTGLVTIAGSFFAFVGEAKAASFVSEITGAEMAGMLITVNFEGGSSEAKVWSATGVDSGAASGADWELSITGDTQFNPWTFEYTGNNTISSLLIEALPGNTVFDTIIFPELTPGTGTGGAFGSFSGLPPTDEIYSGTLPNTLEDVKTSLELIWENGFNSSNAPLVFLADTDGIVDDVAVPEPSAALALLVVLVFGTFVSRKTRNSRF